MKHKSGTVIANLGPEFCLFMELVDICRETRTREFHNRHDFLLDLLI